MMKRFLIIAVSTSVFLSGCATSSSEIASSFSSPLQYQAYDCNQLALEDSEVVDRVSQLGGSIDHRATNDKVAMGVGLVLFWPALFFIKGDGEQAAEYARLKGEHEAITRSAIVKGCGVSNGRLAVYAPQAVGPASYTASYPTPAYQAPPYQGVPAQSVGAAPDPYARVTRIVVHP
jgi:hypothetical protein